MAYSRNNWSVGDPITQEKMNNIEDGIVSAHEKFTDINSLTNRLGKIDGGEALTDPTTLKQQVTDAMNRANQAWSKADTAAGDAQKGATALAQIQGALENPNGEDYDNLANRLQADMNAVDGKFDDVEDVLDAHMDAIADATNAAEEAKTWINNAKVVGTVLKDGRQVTAESLAEKITDIDRKISAVTETASGLSATISPLNGRTYGERLTALDANTVPTMNVPEIITEISNARGQNAQGGNNTALSQRFTQDETRIGANETAISNLQTDKVNVSDIVDNLNQTDINKPLSAKQGNVIKQMFGTGVGTTAGTTVAELITTAQSNAASYADSNKVDKTDVYNGLDHTTDDKKVLDARVGKTLNDAKVNYTDIKDNLTSTDTDKPLSANQGKVLKDSIDSINTAIGATDTDGLKGRIKAVEDEIDAANGSGSLDDRFDAIEGRLDAVDDGSNTIISGINSKVDSIAGELGMLSQSDSTNGTRIDTLEDNLDLVSGVVNNASTGLAATKAIADAAKAKADTALQPADISQLNTDVNDLKDKDTIVVPKVNNTSNFSNDLPNIALANIKPNADYLIEADDNKYYYWRYFDADGGWQQISGAGGGTGNSNSEVYASSQLFNVAEKELNKDYYVLEDGFYHHYRYLNTEAAAEPIEIGTIINSNNIKRYALSSSTDNQTNKNYIDFYEFGYGIENTSTSDGTRIAHIELIGGGSGGGVYNTKQITRISPRNIKWPITSTDKVYLRFFYTNGTALESDLFKLTHENATTASHIIMGGGTADTITSGDPQNASSSWPTKTIQVQEDGQTVNKVVLAEPGDQACPTGFYRIDVTDYCKNLGKQTFVLTVTDLDDENIYTTMKWEITLISLTVASDFTENSINDVGSSINFTYTPSGDIEKTVHFLMDGTQIHQQTLSARTVDEQSYIIPAEDQEGVHQLCVYLSAIDNGNEILSNRIYRDIIWRNANSETLILSSPYRGRTVDVLQYSAIDIPYTIAGNSSSYTVKYYVNNYESSYNEITLTNTSNGVWTYRPLTQGIQNLRIEIGTTHIDFTLNVKENIVDINPYTTNLILNFDPTGLSNNSAAAKQWTNGTYHLSVSDNFDWFNGGYGHDETGDYFLIKSGTRAYFDYKMFTQALEQVETQDNQTISTPTSSVYQTGQEMKIIFKTSAVRSIDAVWFTNTGKYDPSVNTKVGIQLSAHEGWLKTNTASDEAVGTGDEQVAATNTYLYFPYSEEDRIELDININKESSPNGVFAMSYEDGVPSKAYAYTHNQILYQIPDNESIITIGSDDCDVYIYKLRIYNNELTPAQVLRNFIADGKTVDESIERYQRNCIYYDAEHNEYSPYATSGFTLDAEALASKIPNVKVLMLDAPTFTLNKKSFIKNSTLRCIHAPGGTVYPSRGAADNWFFENGYHAGQGTTSDKYGDAGRNIDFLFNCDGTHKPSDKVKNPDPNYISQVTTGYGTESAITSVVSDWKGDTGKISLTSTSIPNNFFNLKVNIASSENVNNALLQKRYNDFLPYIYQSPAYLRDNKIKNDMEFVPAVLFLRENSSSEVHSEFNDTDWHFYALGNLGDSKKTDYTRAYDPEDMNEFTIEISDNNTNNSQFQTGVYLVNGTPTLETFEAVQDVDDDGKLIDDSFTAQGRSGAIATTDYVYPLDTPELKAMWNAVDGQGNYTNKNHWALVNEPYDGDHSFEMRYACCGDYRDGKMVNDTTGQGDAQREKNAKVWQAFYSWVVTSSNEEFIRDLDQWCVRNAVEFWYAFTHYYTMMDNRAKNTFWHFAKTGIYRRVTEPIEDMLHVYVESNDATLVPGTTNEWTGTFTAPSGEFNASNTYYTEYAFDLWDYDNDTALGIDNNGELIFPYGKEDSDYKIDGDASSGFVFNGAGSVFWRRLRDLCTSEISNVFHMATEQFFSSENLITQFDRFQECFPEALWQVDIQRKYIRPFTGDTSGGAKTRQSKRFLESMMQGRKKYQRRQWIKDQYYYFGSKYKLDNVTEDFFYLDCYTGPDDATIAELLQQGDTEGAAQYVGSNWDLTITPYQDMYINASFGETPKSPVRAKAGQPIEMTCPFTSMNNTRIYIYGASRLKALAGKPIKDGNNNIIGAEGLASLYVGVNSIEKTDKLQELYFGTDKTTYRNSNFTKLTLNENSPILETLDIRNCGSIAGELKLGGCNNLRVLEAEGTNITLVTLPSSSQITTLHLPSTITSLTLSAARNLNDFYMKNKSTGLVDYSSLRTLIIDASDESANINWFNITSPILNNLNYLYLLNLKTSSINNMSDLEPYAERYKDISNTMNITGTISVLGSWSTIEVTNYKRLWDVDFITIANNEQAKCAVTYKHSGYQGSEGWVDAEEIETRYIPIGQESSETVIPDIYAGYALNQLPTRPSSISNTYQFGTIEQEAYVPYSGWALSQNDNALSLYEQGYNINNQYHTIASQTSITLYTHYTTAEHQYQVKWYLDDDTVVKTVTNQYYGKGYSLEAPTVKQLRDAGYETAIVDFNEDDTVTYRIFDGWQKLPTNINPTNEEAQTNIYRINAKWYVDTKPLSGANGLFADTSNLTLEQLLVLSRMENSNRGLASHSDCLNIVPTMKFNYQMGFDGTTIGTQIASPVNARRFSNNNLTLASGELARDNNNNVITPFSTDNGFTMVIDYKFDATQSTSADAAVLVGCYARNSGNITGFALYNNFNSNNGDTGIRVGYGDMFNDSTCSKLISSDASQRNIVVLRHPKGSSDLIIYSSQAAHGETLSTSVVAYQPLTVTTQVLTDEAMLCLGNLRNDLSTATGYENEYNNTTGASGVIYYAKYWDEDLGAGECKQLASWPHERMTAMIAAVDGNSTNKALTRPSIFLTNLTASSHGFVKPLKFGTTSPSGWGNSTAKTICDDRIFSGLPIRLQSILSNPNIGYKNYTCTTTYNSFGEQSTNVSLSGVQSASEYVYIPSISSLQTANVDTYAGESRLERTGQALNTNSDITPYTWIGDTQSMVVYNYDTNEESGWAQGTKESKYYNLRFFNKPITWSNSNPIRIFKIPANTLSNRSYYSIIGDLQANDIVIEENDNAYIYIPASEYNNYGIFIEPQGATNSKYNTQSNGGWLKSTSYMTRSVSANNAQNSNFIFINPRGETIMPETSTIQPGALSFTYAFTI